MDNKKTKCHCGLYLHYKDLRLLNSVNDTIKVYGEFLAVKTISGQVFLVQRHYIALHGIRGKDIASLGFDEIKS